MLPREARHIKGLRGITKQTLYRYISPNGELRAYGEKVLKK